MKVGLGHHPFSISCEIFTLSFLQVGMNSKITWGGHCQVTLLFKCVGLEFAQDGKLKFFYSQGKVRLSLNLVWLKFQIYLKPVEVRSKQSVPKEAKS